MKALKTLALVSLSTLGMVSVQADEPVQTPPQGVVTQGQYVETGRSRGLFGRRRYEVVQASANMQQTAPAATTKSTPSVTTTTTTDGKTTPMVQQTTGTQRRGLFGRTRSSRRYNTVTTTSSATTSTATTPSDAKPLPLGK